MTAADERNHWIALYVLCTGMLMIVLDATIVNVALPTIQDDLNFSQSNLAWVVNAYLIAFGGLLLLSGRIGDLIGQRRIFLDRPERVHGLLAVLCGLRDPGDADRRALPAGRRRRADLGRHPGHDRHDVPRAARAGEGDRRVRLRGLRRRLDRPARWAASSPQAINWHWIFFINVPIGIVTAPGPRATSRTGPGIGLDAGRRRARRVLVTAA